MKIYFRDIDLWNVSTRDGKPVEINFIHACGIGIGYTFPESTAVNDRLIYKQRKLAQKEIKKQMRKEENEKR